MAEILYTPQRTLINATAAGNTTVVAAQAGQRVKVVGFYLSASVGAITKFTDGVGGASISGDLRIPAAGLVSIWPGVLMGDPVFALFETSVGNALVMNLSALATVSGVLIYRMG